MAKPHINLTVWKKLHARVRAAAAADARVKVGVFGSAGNHTDTGVSMVELAAIHEYGSPAANIPERSFIRHTLDLREEDLRRVVVRLTKAYIHDKRELPQTLALLGEWVVSAIRNTITSEQVEPKLEDSEAGRRTIKRKGSHVTLIDTGQLLKAITYQVIGVEAPEVPEGDGEE